MNAFTVQELLVGLVISSLIIGFVYGIYVQLGKQMMAYQNDQEAHMHHNQFRQILAKDVHLGEVIVAQDANSFSVQRKGTEHRYTIMKDIIVRNRPNGIRDTFFIRARDFELKEVTNTDHTGQALLVETELFGETITLFESKWQSVANRINERYIDGY